MRRTQLTIVLLLAGTFWSGFSEAATPKKPSFVVTVSIVSGKGTVTPKRVTAKQGKTKTVKITPKKGNLIDLVSVNGAYKTDAQKDFKQPYRLVLSGITTNQTVLVSFNTKKTDLKTLTTGLSIGSAVSVVDPK
mgnify:CR=1 FL=1